jgi:hypothetical protein
MNNYREQFNFNKKSNLITKKGISEDEILKIKNQELSADGLEFDKDNYGDNEPGQNVAIDIAERNLDNPHYEGKLNHEKAQEELQAFAEEVKELIPLFGEQLKYQNTKLKNIGKETKESKIKFSILNAYQTTGSQEIDQNEIIALGAKLDALAAEYDYTADQIERLKAKLMYFNHTALDIPEVDPTHN